jgi:hypothetical protein
MAYIRGEDIVAVDKELDNQVVAAVVVVVVAGLVNLYHILNKIKNLVDL